MKKGNLFQVHLQNVQLEYQLKTATEKSFNGEGKNSIPFDSIEY